VHLESAPNIALHEANRYASTSSEYQNVMPTLFHEMLKRYGHVELTQLCNPKAGSRIPGSQGAVPVFGFGTKQHPKPEIETQQSLLLGIQQYRISSTRSTNAFAAISIRSSKERPAFERT